MFPQSENKLVTSNATYDFVLSFKAIDALGYHRSSKRLYKNTEMVALEPVTVGTTIYTAFEDYNALYSGSKHAILEV